MQLSPIPLAPQQDEISGNLKREKDGFTFLTPNGVTYIPYDGDSSKAWEIDMPGENIAAAESADVRMRI